MLVLAKAHRVGDHFEFEFENQKQRAIVRSTGWPHFEFCVVSRSLKNALDNWAWADENWAIWNRLQFGLPRESEPLVPILSRRDDAPHVVG